MWSPSLASIGKLVVAGALLSATTSVEACLFPCLFGWGGYYAPPPMYGAPMYGGPAYAPSPCGPGGCSPCGPGGCSSFYGPQACCVPCGGSCSPCSGGRCSSGACGVNYGGDMRPQADDGPTRAKTYTDTNTDAPATGGTSTSTSGMPDDDFGPTQHGADGPETGLDPFKKPATAPATEGGATPPPAGAQPINDQILPDVDVMGLEVAPVRSRTIARAHYRVPRVARLQVQPETRWLSVNEGRVARR